MKKFFMSLILIFLISSVAYGAASEDVYVRQDVFDAKMEAWFNKLHSEIADFRSEIKTEIADFRTEVKTEIADLRGDIKELSGRIDGLDYKVDVLQTVVYWGLGILSFIIGSFVLAPIVGGIIQNLRRPQFTLEDIRRLIEENNAKFRPQA